MADADEVIHEEFTPADAPGDGSPDLGARAEVQDAVQESPIEIWAVLGKVSMPIYQILRLGRSAVIVLDQAVHDPVEIRVNNQLIARGGVVIIEERVGIMITECVSAVRSNEAGQTVGRGR